MVQVLVKGPEERAGFRDQQGCRRSRDQQQAEKQLQLGGLGGKGRKWYHWEWGVGGEGGAGELKRRTTPPKGSCGQGGTGHCPEHSREHVGGKITQHLSPFTLHLLALPAMDQTHPEA